jgi:hypothetical protein
MNPKLHSLLSIQGELLDNYLEQNMGERYAYVIVAIPAQGPFNLSVLTNFRDRELIEPVLRDFATRLTGSRPEEIIEVNKHPLAHEAAHG